MRDDRVDYIVVAGMSKNDLALKPGSPALVLTQARDYTRPVVKLGNPFTALEDFILLQVDRAALEAYLAKP